MTKLQGLIFDLDGTLIDSAPDIRNALNATLNDFSRKQLTLEEVKNMMGDGMLIVLERAFAATGDALPDNKSFNIFQQFITYYRNLKPDPAQIYPYARETLVVAKNADIKLGICTQKQENLTRRLLQDIALEDYFDFIAGGDTFMVHKPHPDHVRGVIEGLGITSEGCVMIGDSKNDVLAAKGAGIPCLVVAHGYGGDLKSLNADGVIRGFQKLPDALEQLGFRRYN